MPFSLMRLGAAGFAGLFLLAGAETFAQDAAPPAPAPAHPAPKPAPKPAAKPAPKAPPKAAAPKAPAPTEQQAQPQPAGPAPVKVDLFTTLSDWTKVCGRDQNANKDVCLTKREFSAQADQAPVLALAISDISGDDTRVLQLLMPVGLLLRPGLRMAVDQGGEIEGNFEICFPNGCLAVARVNGATVDQLKKGGTMNVAVKNQANQVVIFAIPLAGFGKAFDGPAMDPKVLEEQQKKMQEELQKRADDERKRLEAAKPGAAAPAPAPATPPKP